MIARLMTVGRDTLSKAETVTVAAVEAGVPPLVEARENIAEFHLPVRRKTEAGLVPWIERARASAVASIARGVTNDEAAVLAAITSVQPAQLPAAAPFLALRCLGTGGVLILLKSERRFEVFGEL